MYFKRFQWCLVDLSRYLGKNTQPWFLYGAEIQPEEREKIFKLFNQRGNDGKSLEHLPNGSKMHQNAYFQAV